MGCAQSGNRAPPKNAPENHENALESVKVEGGGLIDDTTTTKEESQTPELLDLASLGKLSDKYELESTVLGVGQFATVKSCVEKATGKKCAAKLIKRVNTSEERLALEIDILRKIKGHPNVVGLYDVYVTDNEVQLVMEFVCGGELFDHLVESGPYSEAEAVYHMRRIVSAVEFLHRQGITHRDLKPENLLLTSQDPKYAEVKLADFGLARLCSESAMQTVCGTWAYCAPEVRNNPGGYGPKVDIWSLGVILYVLLVAFHPFDPRGQASEEELWHNAERGMFTFQESAWRTVSDDAKDLIKRLIVVDPGTRYDASDVLSHPWITGGTPPTAPLTPRINLDLKEVRSKYARQKLGGAAKAAFASAAFSSMLAKKAPAPDAQEKDGQEPPSQPNETRAQEVTSS